MSAYLRQVTQKQMSKVIDIFTGSFQMKDEILVFGTSM